MEEATYKLPTDAYKQKDTVLSSIPSENKDHLIQSRPNIRKVENSGIIYFHFFGKKRRRLSSKHSSTLIFITILIIVITILFVGVIVPNFWHPMISLAVGLVSSALSLLTLFFLFQVATTIPGYISTTNTMSYEDYIKKPPSVEIEGKQFQLKYCETCCVVRYPRSFHCKLCDRCVLRHDHHCDFVANCIGKNNFNHFFFFLLFTELYCIDVIVAGVFFYSHYSTAEGQFSISILYIIIVGIALFFAVIFGALLTYFLGFHIYLISTNATTNENIRNKYDYTVFDKGCKENWTEVFCRSTIDPNEDVEENTQINA